AIKGSLVVAAIVLESGHSRVWKGLWRNKIAAAHLCRVEAQFMCDTIHGALQDIGSLGSSSASIRGCRRFIGENAGHLALYSLQLVGAAHHRWCAGGYHYGREGEKGAKVSYRAYFQAE